MKPFIALLLLTSTALAADMQVHRDLPYSEPKDRQRTLDVYAPAEGEGHPVIVWIHGGGWQKGDKAVVHQKPQAFVGKGFVFVSANYRLLPDATIRQMAADVAKAVRRVHEHAAEYGGDPKTIFVMGHSAGAQLAALVCTDETLLKTEGLSLAHVRGCIPVDTAAYDVPRKAEDQRPLRAQLYAAFGEDEEAQRKVSPIHHVAKGKSIPPFLILHVASRPDSTTQSQAFARALRDAGVEARLVPAVGKTHGTINQDLGRPGDKPTAAVFEFLSRVLKK